MDDLAVRSAIYRHIVDTGSVPLRNELGDVSDEQMQRIHDAHMIVLDDRPHRRGEIRMALPFAAEPTDFHVETANGAWFANCAWDSLAIAAAMHDDAVITATWHDTGEPLMRRVVDGVLDDVEGFVHFVLPARRWWDDIVFT